MNLYLNRCYSKSSYVIGKLFIEDDYFCDTLEPAYEGAHPCIEAGTYKVTLDVKSPRFSKGESKDTFYKFCDYKLPRLLDVPGRDGILIHKGNYPRHTKGCILVGKNISVSCVYDSMRTFVSLYNKLLTDKDNIHIHIYNTILNR